MLITRGKRTQQNLIDDINNQITSINQSINDMEIQSSSRNSTYIHSFLTPKKEVNCKIIWQVPGPGHQNYGAQASILWCPFKLTNRFLF